MIFLGFPARDCSGVPDTDHRPIDSNVSVCAMICVTGAGRGTISLSIRAQRMEQVWHSLFALRSHDIHRIVEEFDTLCLPRFPSPLYR